METCLCSRRRPVAWALAALALLPALVMGCGRIGSVAGLARPAAPAAAAATSSALPPHAWPMFGGTPARNMVNPLAKDAPTDWSVEEGKHRNVRWMAEVGTKAYGGVVIAGGKVYVGTNNERPRDPKLKGAKAVIMCFEEATGKFLWQAVHDEPPDDIAREALKDGMCAPPTVEGKRLYYVTPACVVVCADAETGKSLWQLDMMKDLKVYPDYVASCAPLVVGDLVYVVTGNGLDMEGKLVSPDAPSFVAVNKNDGKVAWQSKLPGKNIIEGQWSSPAYGEVNGKGQVIFPGGDGWLYALEPATGSLIWKFNCNPKGDLNVVAPDGVLNYLVATPVIHDNKCYIGVGVAPETGKVTRYGHFWCVDITKTGDVSPAGSLDPKAAENKASALVWHYGGVIEPRPKLGRPVVFGRTMSTAAVHDGLVYINEEAGYLHCLDAATGKKYWEYDFKSSVWGAAFWADGKVYCATEDTDVVILAHGKEKKVLATISVEEALHSTPIVVDSTLYVLTDQKLYAIGKK